MAAALSVPGVVEVDTQVAVNRSPGDIRANIEDRLYWDPRVARDRVGIAVGADGVATLTGTLNTWSEIKSATDDALAAGASRVINLLKLKNHPEFILN